MSQYQGPLPSIGILFHADATPITTLLPYPAPIPSIGILTSGDNTAVEPGRLEASMFYGQAWAGRAWFGQAWGRSRTTTTPPDGGGGGGGGGGGPTPTDGWTRIARDTQTWTEV